MGVLFVYENNFYGKDGKLVELIIEVYKMLGSKLDKVRYKYWDWKEKQI